MWPEERRYHIVRRRPAVPVPVDHQHFANSLWCAYIVSVLSAWNAEIVTYPLDLIKTRMQIQGEMADKGRVEKTAYRGLLKTGIGIATEEGPFKLWKGLYAVFCRHLIYSGTRMVVYRTLKEKVFSSGAKDDYMPIWKACVCGCSAGAFGQLVASPADLLKTQIQMEGKRKLMGLPPRVDGLVDAFRKTVAVAGYKGLWAGAIPNVQRAALVTFGDLAAYDVAKSFLLHKTSLEDDHFLHFVASFFAGFVAASMGNPTDVIKTRIMNQPLDDRGQGTLYSSTTDCLVKTVRNEGPLALYKGFLPLWFRLAPWSLVFWLTYEELLHAMGADQF